MESVKRTIRAELSRQKNQNTGYGFLIFADDKIVKDFKHLGKSYFHNLIDERLPQKAIDRLAIKRWSFFQAFPQSDIIWEDFTKDSVISRTKTVILWVFLILISVILITPQLIFEYWKDVENKLDLHYKWISKESVNEYI